jgi:hypothetical protein
MRLRRSRLAIVVVLLAWLVLAMHLCADPSGAHDGGALDRMASHGHHHGETTVPGSASDGDCHSAWVSQNPPAFGGHAARQTLEWPVSTSGWVAVAPELTDRIELTNRAPDSAPPPLYLLDAALLI